MGYKSPLNSKHSPKLWFKFPSFLLFNSRVSVGKTAAACAPMLTLFGPELSVGAPGLALIRDHRDSPRPKKKGGEMLVLPWNMLINAGLTMKHADQSWFNMVFMQENQDLANEFWLLWVCQKIVCSTRPAIGILVGMPWCHLTWNFQRW